MPIRGMGGLAAVTLAALIALASGCGPLALVRYAVSPDPPELSAGEEIALAALAGPVEVARRADGLWRIEAESERDALVAQGYLVARDRLAQMDLLRHVAHGRLAALLGLRAFGDRTTLDVDRLNRFLGFSDTARRLYDAASPAERDALLAFAAGIDAWIAADRRSLEHRLLGVERVEPWSPLDSLAIYAMVMHGLSGNADREIRRLAIACAAGLPALERIWPTDLEFAVAALPREAWRAERRPPAPGVAPELAAELTALCAAGAAAPGAGARAPAPLRFAGPLDPLRALAGFSASNSWAVSGAHTASGKPVFASDPHLPHMNPPIVWGLEIAWPGVRRAGFALIGTPRIAFGHNGRVAWGATTNHVDRQDLVVHRPKTELQRGVLVDGYELDGAFVPFERREEVFEVKGAEPVRMTARFTRDGPLLADLELLPAGLPALVALRVTSPDAPGDVDAAAATNAARSAAEFAGALAGLDLGCSAWLFADADGHLGLRSPCRVPRREGWRGTFPVPGWLGRYAWRGVVPKSELPAADDPAQGWLAAANSQLVPSERFPTAYNNDVASPSRWLRISARLGEARAGAGLGAAGSAAIQLDVRLEPWPALRRALDTNVCATARRDEPPAAAEARAALCAWDGTMAADAPAASLHTLFTHALLDRALADELPGGADGELWRFVQSLLHFEAVVEHLFALHAASPVWDDVRTPARETRAELFERAFASAAAEAGARWGGRLADWSWGRVRPFPLRHLFAADDGPGLAWLLNATPAPAPGGTETVWKQQFVRSDRAAMHPAVGPVLRLSLDLAEPWSGLYALAGGESGWPRSRFYGNLLDDWRAGHSRPLTPPPAAGDVEARLVPPAAR